MKKKTNNKRLSLRRKRRRLERLEKYKQDLLYEQSRIDPQTIEGQSVLPINELVSIPKPNKKLNLIQRIFNKIF